MKKKSEEKVKIEIIATDKIGREESIRLIVSKKIASRLMNAENVRYELSYIEDIAHAYGCKKAGISESQYRKIRTFDNLIYHKFYNYSLEVK